MKNLIKITSTIIMLAGLVACGNNGGSSSTNTANTVAATPLNNQCLNGQVNCSQNYYTYGYSNYGVVPYPVNFYNYGGLNSYWNTYGQTGQFCNCPAGYMPMFNGNLGVACMPTNTFQGNYAYGYFNWGAYAANYQNTSIPQYSNYQNFRAVNGCYTQMAQTCFIDVANECGLGATCLPTAAGSRFGVCRANGYVNNQYGSVGYR